MKNAARPTSKRRRTFGPELRAALRPALVYWIFLAAMFGAFAATAMIAEPNVGSIGAVALLGGTTAVAVLAGQILALLRVRDWVLYVFTVIWWAVGFTWSTALAAAAGPLGGLAAVVVLLFPLFLTGGLWSLRTGRALFAAWVPLLYASATAIWIAEARGKVATWMAGQKYAVWDVATFGVLVVGIVLLLAFLVAREGHRLVLWRHAPRAPLEAQVAESGAARPKLTLLGWVLLCGLAFGVAVGAAAIAPYLWRTKEDEDATAQSEQAQPQDPQQQPPKQSKNQKTQKGNTKADKGKPTKLPRYHRGKGENSDLVEVREDLRPEQQGAGGLSLDPWTLFLLALIGLVLGGPPTRRLWLIERLRSPGRRVSSTAQVEGGWRLVEIALADAGVERLPGEPASGLVQRAGPTLQQVSPVDVHGLAQAAEIRDRVAYGLGVSQADVDQMRRVANTAFDTVWDRLGDRGQIRALYRWI